MRVSSNIVAIKTLKAGVDIIARETILRARIADLRVVVNVSSGVAPHAYSWIRWETIITARYPWQTISASSYEITRKALKASCTSADHAVCTEISTRICNASPVV